MEQNAHYDFQGLEAWQKCKAIRDALWTLTRQFPPEEKYRLADQMVRASRSTTACIAEGYGRFHFQENIQFCRQARGSLYELIDHVDVALTCEYLAAPNARGLVEDIKTAIKVLNGHIRYLNKSKINA